MVASGDMGRPKKYNYPPNMTRDVADGRFVVRNPVTKKRKKFGDEAEALEAVKVLNEFLEVEQQYKALAAGRPTIAGLVTKWEADRLQFMPWDTGTRKNMLAKMHRISRELGARALVHTDCLYLEEWLTRFCRTADTWNKWRYALVLLWKFALSRRLVDVNEPEKIEERSTSKKLEANRKARQPLDVDGYRAIYEKAPAWLQLAMDQSLVTLQGRQEICNMRHVDHRDGHLFVIRDKPSGDSDMAFIKIALTPQLVENQTRARALDNTVSPYLIHRRPDSRRRQRMDNKPHWTYINPDYLTKAFAEVRDQLQRFSSMPAEERPSFHEIRGLGSRIYRDAGMSEAAIQALMTHAHRRTTQIYLEGGAKALTDDDYVAVVAPLTLRDLK